MDVIPQTFGTVDLIIFLFSLALGVFIGIYFAYFAPKGSNEEADYLVGDRNMGIFPIAVSLVASYVSGITLLGVPAEVSKYGCQVMYFNIVTWIVSYLYIKQILPVFHGLQGLSLNEYFVNRFDRRLRILGSILYVTGTMGWLPIVIYVPALAYEQVTGYNVHLVTPFVCLVCIFYTSIGGIKAVVWTDVIQMVSMILCVAMVAIKGTMDAGGVSQVWEKNIQTGRIEPPLIDFDPTVRHTIFGIIFGGFFGILHSGCLSQGMVQRYQTLKTLDRAQKTVWFYTVFVVFTSLLSGYCGLVIAANYFSCDPITIQLARTHDQIVPLFVMESIGRIPGMAGLFIAGIFSAALSSMSTALNTMSGVFLEDWIRGCNIWNPTDHQASWTMKIFVVVMGVLTVALVSVVEKLGMVLQMSGSIAAMSTGPMVTIFLCGLFLPWVTATGALVGAVTAVMSLAPIMFPTQVFLSQGFLHFPAKPVSLEGCTQKYNVTQDFINSVKVPEETFWPMGPTRGNVPYPIRISYLWYTPISVSCGLIAAILFTIFVSRMNLKHVDRRLIAPMCRRWLPFSEEDSPERGKHTIIAELEEPVKSQNDEAATTRC